MSAPQKFRSAFNGFNREDVVHYIEYLTSRHTAEINQLTSELDFLKSKQLTDQTPLALEMSTAAQAEKEVLQARIAELEARCAALESEDLIVITDEGADRKVKELEARCASLEAQLKEALAAALPVQATPSNMEQELEAYRRAERAERLAQERAALVEQIANENAERTEQLAKAHAAQVYNQANSALADATVKVDAAAAEISTMVDSAMQQLAQLQAAVTGSKQALKDAAVTMYAIHSADNR